MHVYSTCLNFHAPGILLPHMNAHVTRCLEWLWLFAAGSSWWAVLLVCPQFLIWHAHAHTRARTHTLLTPPCNDLAATSCQGNGSHGVRGLVKKKSHTHPYHLCSEHGAVAVVRTRKGGKLRSMLSFTGKKEMKEDQPYHYLKALDGPSMTGADGTVGKGQRR